MNAIEWATTWMAIIGFLSGLYALWLSDKSARQDLAIERTDRRLLRFRVVNRSTRPIPVQSISLALKEGDIFKPSQDTPRLQGITLPGTLAPESAFEVEWAGTRQIVELIFYERYRLKVETQTGAIFTLEGTTKKTPEDSKEPREHPIAFQR